jgi:P-type Mg2+ transporter
MIAENVGFVPGGLGTFEATGVATLHACGTPIAPALAATLLLRALTFWLPMLPGLWFGEREIAAGTARAS